MCEQAGILYNILCGRPLQIWTDLCKECIIKLSTNSNICFLDCYFHGCVKKIDKYLCIVISTVTMISVTEIMFIYRGSSTSNCVSNSRYVFLTLGATENLARNGSEQSPQKVE